MAILVDEPIWPWRGRRWAHLITDSHLDELHDFAHRLGMPYLAFQGDHYDIHTELRERAVSAGARPVTGREVVVALRESGLRRRGAVEPWAWLWDRTTSIDQIVRVARTHRPAAVADILHLAEAGAPLAAGMAARSGEELLVVSSPDQLPVEAGLIMVEAGQSLHRSCGERGTYLEWLSVTGGA